MHQFWEKLRPTLRTLQLLYLQPHTLAACRMHQLWPSLLSSAPRALLAPRATETNSVDCLVSMFTSQYKRLIRMHMHVRVCVCVRARTYMCVCVWTMLSYYWLDIKKRNHALSFSSMEMACIYSVDARARNSTRECPQCVARAHASPLTSWPVPVDLLSPLTLRCARTVDKSIALHCSTNNSWPMMTAALTHASASMKLASTPWACIQ